MDVKIILLTAILDGEGRRVLNKTSGITDLQTDLLAYRIYIRDLYQMQILEKKRSFVPAAILTIQVTDVPCCSPRSTRGDALG